MRSRHKKVLASWMLVPAKDRARSPKVDEVLELPFGGSIIRAGRHVELRSHRTPEQQQALIDRLEASHSKVEQGIQSQVERAIELVRRYEPTTLLHRAYMEFYAKAVTLAGEHDVDFERTIDVRMLDYVQSLIVSAEPAEQQVPVDDVGYRELRDTIRELYAALMHMWPSTETAHRTKHGLLDPQVEDFRMPLLMHWLSVRGNRQAIHQREALLALVEPQDAILRDSFGVTAEELGDAAAELTRRLGRGVGDSVRRMYELHAIIMSDANLEGFDPTGMSDHEVANALADRSGHGAEFRRAAEEACTTAPFDVSKLLPTRLLMELSLGPGESPQFISPGEYAGWPLRTPPTALKPILRCKESYFLFNPFSVEALYRGVEQAVVRQRPELREKWNANQKVASERVPLDLLRSLLPGATVHEGVHYPLDVDGVMRWNECDAVVFLDDLLLAVEVKGGRATEHSPFSGLNRHLQNVDKLLTDPVQQADRFLRYLASAPEVPIYDEQHAEVARLRRQAHATTVRCAVTADSLSAVAGSFRHSGREGTESLPPAWVLSVDDLRAYRDVLSGPVAFHHFLKVRLQAFARSDLQQLDHLGAYLSTNDYVTWTRQANATSVALHGYRAALDKFFGEAFEHGALPERPGQAMPPLMAATICALERDRPKGFLLAGAALLNLSGEARTMLMNRVATARGVARDVGRAQLVCSGGREPAVFVVVRSRTEDYDDVARVRDHALAQMLIGGAITGMLFRLQISDSWEVTSARVEPLDTRALTLETHERLRGVAADLIASRARRLKEDRVKVGANDPCFCGSARKYKKCCRLRGL